MVARTNPKADRVAQTTYSSRLILIVACFVLSLIILPLSTFSSFAQMPAEIVATTEDGFGRIVLKFERMPKYSIRVTTGVLVVAFDEPVDLDPRKVTVNLSDFIGAARVDPDRRAVRFALARTLRINSMEAGDELFIDLLPGVWQGLAPGLPEEVIARLALRAELAEAKARRDALEAAARENAAVIEVQAGQYQTFSRISFNWNQPFNANVARDGDTLRVTFNKLATIDLSKLIASKPEYLSSISSHLTDRGLVLELVIAKDAAMRAFVDGRSYIVDLSPNGSGFSGANGGRDFGNEAAEIRLPGAAVNDSDQPVWQRRNQSTITTEFVPLDPEHYSTKDYGDWVNQIDVLSNSDNSSANGVNRSSAGALGQLSQSSALAAEDVDISVETATEVPVITQRHARSVDIKFRFPEAVRAAVFQRGDTIWSVFESDIPIKIGSLQADLADRLDWVQVTRAGAMQYVRMKLKSPALTSVAGRNRLWTITIGDMVAEPTKPLQLRRLLGDDGLPRIVVDLPDAGRVHLLNDAELGDRLAVVTAYGPAQGLIKQQNFVEFVLFPSAHGLALKLIADDLIVTSQIDEVVIGRRQGLWLSPADGLAEVVERDASGESRPAYIDYARFLEGGIRTYVLKHQKYELDVTQAPEEELTDARLELVRFYLAHLLASEASAILSLIQSDDPGSAKGPVFNALAGISKYMMGRADEAMQHFNAPGLAQGREVILWRGLAAALRGNWKVAKQSIESGEDLLWQYPNELRARFFATAARSALELNDLGATNHHLAVLEDIEVSRKIQAEVTLLRGRYLVGLGQSAAGLEMYESAIESGIRPIEAEARYLKLALLQDGGAIETDDLISRLENLGMTWRGGNFELITLHRLSDLYSEQGKFRELFEVMKTASNLSYDSAITRDIQDKIAVSFRELFLGEQADNLSPIEALSLFYDHRVLTPIGRQGDEMIRRLAERLVDVDLLDQAAELLAHQVDNRLKGAAQAQVAAQLALVHLMNRKPVEAVRVLNRTQRAGIPRKIQRQRNILKARALSDAGRMELALDILNTMLGEDVDIQKAEILWHARAWQGAAEQYEIILGEGWKSEDPLTELQRSSAMRAAISYSLANDQLGLDRLRTKFFQKMSEGPDAQAFQVVTSPVADRGLEFRELARSIAAVDTLESFLEDFRGQQSELNAQGSGEPQG